LTSLDLVWVQCEIAASVYSGVTVHTYCDYCVWLGLLCPCTDGSVTKFKASVLVKRYIIWLVCCCGGIQSNS